MASLRKAWRDWPPHTLANKPRFGKYHPPFVCEVSMEGFVSEWLLHKHNKKLPAVSPMDVMTLGQKGRRRGGGARGATAAGSGSEGEGGKDDANAGKGKAKAK